MGNVEGLCWICRLRLWLASFQHQSQELWEQRQMVTSVSRLQGCCMNGSPKPWPGCRALLPNVTCHSSTADVSVSHESSISHWTWVIDRKEIHHGVSEAHLSVLGTRMVPFTSLIPSPKISLQLPPFLTMSLPKPKPPSHLYHPCTLSSQISLILSCFASYTNFPSSPQTHQAPFKLGSLPCLNSPCLFFS